MSRAAVIAGRRAYVPSGAVRAEWGRLIEAAADVAAQASGRVTHHPRAAGRGGPAERLLDFRHLALREPPGAFPVPGASVALMVEAFRRQASAFAHAAADETRALYAPALAASAELLDELLATQRAEAADVWRRRTGERD